ncbi:MAG: hypothetical protein OXE94_00670, partial [Aestuariivita sp.]|nr:hypothetical protein [Aestuariivita sp.]
WREKVREIRGNEPILWKKYGSSLAFVLAGYIGYLCPSFAHRSPPLFLPAALGSPIHTEDTQSSAAQLSEILVTHENGEERLVPNEDKQPRCLILELRHSLNCYKIYTITSRNAMT